MMHSMTGFGSAQVQGDIGTITLEVRSVNSRYLDLTCRIPEELRHAEMLIREQISRSLSRGKVEVRASYARAAAQVEQCISDQTIATVQSTFERAQKVIPQLQNPTLSDLLQWPDSSRTPTDPTQWVALCQKACEQAIEQLQQNRLREGERLATIINTLATEVDQIVQALERRLPELMTLQQERLVSRMKEALSHALPNVPLTATEFSERINAEASLFSLRADVAEEIGRLRSHLAELQQILHEPARKSGPNKGHGKRLDFLFQEMNREANTLGSKAVHMDMTRTAIDLKLLIEQMREQIQNIE